MGVLKSTCRYVVASALALTSATACSFLYNFGNLEGSEAGAEAEASIDASGVEDAGPPSKCELSTFRFCDGFENGLDAWTPSTSGGGEVRTDSTHAFRGNLALHGTLPSAAVQTTMLAEVLRPAWSVPIYVRFFAYLSPAMRHASPTNLFGLNYAPPQLSGVVLDVTGGDGTLGLSTFGSAPPGNASSTAPLPTEQWLCVEVEADGTNLYVWVDGILDAPLTVAFPATSPGLLANFGLVRTPASAGDGQYDAWFDEFAVDSSRIYCQR
jgi:hypothetical protein